MSKTILVIENSGDMQRVFQQLMNLLPKNSIQIHWVYNATDGISFLEREIPSIILLDFDLGSSWEVFQYIQSQARLRWIPLIVMSGRKKKNTDKISGLFEYFHFCEKPFNGRELKQAIQVAIVQTKQRYQKDSKHSIFANYFHTNIKPIHLKLQELIIKKNWKKADAETTRLTFTVDRQLLNKDSSSVRKAVVQAIDNFLLEDLQAIDYLWVIHSDGHFGFSVQWDLLQQIRNELYQIFEQIGFFEGDDWQNISVEERQQYVISFMQRTSTYSTASIGDSFQDFLSRYNIEGILTLPTALTIDLGWLRKGSPEWTFNGEINYSLDSPKGHLPTVGRQELGSAFHHGFMLTSIFAKLYD